MPPRSLSALLAPRVGLSGGGRLADSVGHSGRVSVLLVAFVGDRWASFKLTVGSGWIARPSAEVNTRS